jgi:hypothetical protein
MACRSVATSWRTRRRDGSGGKLPVGRVLELVYQRLEQQDHEEMRKQIRLGGAFVDPRRPFEADQAFEPFGQERARSGCHPATGLSTLLSNNHAVRFSSQVQDLQMGSSRPSKDRFTDILKGWGMAQRGGNCSTTRLGTAARNQRLTLHAELRRPGPDGCQADRGNAAWVCDDSALHAKSGSRAGRPENLTYPAE